MGAGGPVSSLPGPVGYKEIEEEMAKRSAAHEEFLASIQLRIQQRLEQEGIRCKVYGR